MMSHADLLMDVLAQVRPLVLTSARIIDTSRSADGLTVGTRAVLAVLDQQGARTVPALAATMDLTRQAVQRHVDELRERGMVAARPNPAHRRSVLIEVTAAGSEVWSRRRERERADLAQVATALDDDELRTAARVLHTLNVDLRARLAQGPGEVA